MPDLHRPRAAAAKDPASTDQPSSDARSHRDVQDGIKPAAGAEMGFGIRGRIGVVVQHGRQAQVRLEPLDQAKSIPARDLMARDDQSAGCIDRTTETNAHSRDRLSFNAGLHQQFVDSGNDLLVNASGTLWGIYVAAPQRAKRLAFTAADRDQKFSAADFDAQIPLHLYVRLS